MNLPLIVIISLFFALIGFTIGRLGDKYGGRIVGPHHWIYGLILAMIGIFYLERQFGLWLFAFGTGHFISDMKDFLQMKIWGADEPHNWRFWSIE